MRVNYQTVIVFIVYLLGMLAIGVYFWKKNKNLNDYVLGGRGLNVWVAALSAQASDMSGWLLMGLPGLAFLYYLTEGGAMGASYAGMGEAIWTAIGLAAGTYLNWLLVAKRLRKYTQVAGDSITMPDYFQNRFHSKNNALRIISALFILVFFLLYTASGFAAGSKLFQMVFGLDYKTALIIGAVIIISYTFLGGFLAVCWTDLIQGLLMFAAIIITPIVCVFRLGGIGETVSMFHANNLEWGVQAHFLPHTAAGTLSLTVLFSGLAWGLGYFGQPHILSRFMAIRSSKDVRPARIIAMIWVVLSLAAAVVVGIVGTLYLQKYHPAGIEMLLADREKIFMVLVTNLFPALIAGVLLTAILAAIMSTADSQLLVTSSCVANDFYRALFKKDASQKELLWVSRITVIVVSVIAVLIALDPDSSVFALVSNAWAGFGATFGPAILISLYWKRMTTKGALAGIISGGVTVILWLVLKAYTGITLYEMIPGVAVSTLFIFIVSLLDKKPEQAVIDEFDSVKNTEI